MPSSLVFNLIPDTAPSCALTSCPRPIELYSDTLAGGRLVHGAIAAVLTNVDTGRNGRKSGDAWEAARQMRDKLKQEADQRLAQQSFTRL